jgi:hypothetical protein
LKDAIDRIPELIKSDLVVLDLVMPSGQRSPNPKSGARNNGMILYSKLREISKSLPIIVFTANQDRDVMEVIEDDPSSKYIPRWSGPSLSDFIGEINQTLGIEPAAHNIQSFIVHGHDEAAKYALKNYLQNILRLPEPTILHESADRGRTIMDKFEDLGGEADLVFVLMTPGDKLATGNELNPDKRRARQNVIFEMGYFLGSFGRRAGRVILLHKGDLDLPSDIAGLVYISIDNGIDAAGELIRREIQAITTEHGNV